MNLEKNNDAARSGQTGLSQENLLAQKIDNEKQKELLQASDISLYLTFTLKKDIYGIEVSYVREVMHYPVVFPVPGTPSHIKGVINLRGEVVPVIDLSVWFHDESCELSNETGIIVVEISDDSSVTPIGIMIDYIHEVLEIKNHRIEVAPDIGSRINPDYISGIGKNGNEFIILLDAEKVLNINSLSKIT